MMSDLDIARAAYAYIKNHGEDAEIECAVRVDALMAEGDWLGYLNMKRVYLTIVEFRRHEPMPSERLH